MCNRLGTDGGVIPLLLSYITADQKYSKDAVRYSLEILCNLCLHHTNRKIIFDNGGINPIVSLHIDEDEHVRRLSMQVIEHLGDLTPPEVLARAKADIGLEKMVSLATSEDAMVRAVAAESIGEEIWMDSKKQIHAQRIGAVDALLAIARNKEEPVDSLIPALWSLRNLMHDNPDGQAQFGYRDGVLIVSLVMRKALTGAYLQHSADVFEACLTCLTTACIREEKNSRRLLIVGLEPILDLAEGAISKKRTDFVNVEDRKVLSTQHDNQLKIGLQNEGVLALAKSLLLMLAPYNYIVCKNCQKKQDLRGTSCYNCGNRLLVDVEYKKDTYLPKKNAKGLPSSSILNETAMNATPTNREGDEKSSIHSVSTTSLMKAAVDDTLLSTTPRGGIKKKLYSTVTANDVAGRGKESATKKSLLSQTAPLPSAKP